MDPHGFHSITLGCKLNQFDLRPGKSTGQKAAHSDSQTQHSQRDPGHGFRQVKDGAGIHQNVLAQQAGHCPVENRARNGQTEYPMGSDRRPRGTNRFAESPLRAGWRNLRNSAGENEADQRTQSQYGSDCPQIRARVIEQQPPCCTANIYV